MRVPEANAPETRPEIDLIHHQINHKALETLPMATTPATTAVHQVNLLALLLPQEQGDIILASTGDEVQYDNREIHFVRSHLANWKKHKLCLLLFHVLLLHLHLLQRLPERTTSLQPFNQDDNGTPATWTLVLFQQAIDRQDRTLLQSRRTLQLYWNHWRHSLHRTLSHYYRTRTHHTTMMTCRHPTGYVTS